MEINIKLIIPDTKVQDLRVGLAKYFKIDSTDINAAWFKAFLQDIIFKFYKTGKVWVAQETTPALIDENIIEVQ